MSAALHRARRRVVPAIHRAIAVKSAKATNPAASDTLPGNFQVPVIGKKEIVGDQHRETGRKQSWTLAADRTARQHRRGEDQQRYVWERSRGTGRESSHAPPTKAKAAA